jgi:hypothetical protein
VLAAAGLGDASIAYGSGGCCGTSNIESVIDTQYHLSSMMAVYACLAASHRLLPRRLFLYATAVLACRLHMVWQYM